MTIRSYRPPNRKAKVEEYYGWGTSSIVEATHMGLTQKSEYLGGQMSNAMVFSLSIGRCNKQVRCCWRYALSVSQLGLYVLCLRLSC